MSTSSQQKPAKLRAPKKKALLRAIVVGVGTAMCAYMLYFAVGFFTGIYGICSIASASWMQTFDSLYVLVPIIGLIGFLGRWWLEMTRSDPNMPPNQALEPTSTAVTPPAGRLRKATPGEPAGARASGARGSP